MNWQEKYTQPQPFEEGDKVIITKPLYMFKNVTFNPDFKKGDIATLETQISHKPPTELGTLWRLKEFSITAFECEFERL